MKGAEFDPKLVEIGASVVNEVNELREKTLFTIAERGYVKVVKWLFPYTTKGPFMKKTDPVLILFTLPLEKANKVLIIGFYKCKLHL